MSTRKFPREKYPPRDYAAMLEEKNNDRALRKDDRRRHDGKPDEYVPPSPVRQLVADGEPTGVASLNEERETRRRIVDEQRSSEPRSVEDLTQMMRRTVQRAVEMICLPAAVPTPTELETLDRCAGILAKLTRLEPEMTAEQFEEQERARRAQAPA